MLLCVSVVLRRPDSTALSGVDLWLQPGKLTALVGLSGSGKTTLVSLLQRLYDPTGELSL
jgi:ABC-type multidrug transport system fused ATPase/permease subunit